MIEYQSILCPGMDFLVVLNKWKYILRPMPHNSKFYSLQSTIQSIQGLSLG